MYIISDEKYKKYENKLIVMRTTGDGDCLIHAVSLSLCGSEDLEKRLRQIMVLTLTSSCHVDRYKEMYCVYESLEDESFGFPNAREPSQLLKDFDSCINEAAQAGMYCC